MTSLRSNNNNADRRAMEHLRRISGRARTADGIGTDTDGSWCESRLVPRWAIEAATPPDEGLDEWDWLDYSQPESHLVNSNRERRLPNHIDRRVTHHYEKDYR